VTDDNTKAAPAPPNSDLSLRASPYPRSRLAPRFDLVDVAAQIAHADATVSLVASAKLDVIRRQIQALQAEAKAILDEAAISAQLHRVACNLKKAPGRVYHLYRRESGELYFSLLSPDDWGGEPPHPFEGSYRLELDHSFTRA